jgi:hypothetical protein
MPGIFGVTHRRPWRVLCLSNLRSIGVYLTIYAEDHNDTYPPAERWCDAIVDFFGSDDAGIRDHFRCRAAETGPCNYAMNPNAGRREASDVVLLFESKPGWNRSGGPELLTTENHQGKGCSVLFTDLHVEFVKAEYLSELKWTYVDAADANHPIGSTSDTRN